MQLSVTVTSLGGALVIQDPHPTHGIFSKTVPAGSSLTFTCPWDIWVRINTQIEAYRVAGLCTVALSETTPTGTDNTSGPNTTYNRADWAFLNSFRKDITALQSALGAVSSPFSYKGDIAVATDFPLIADVESAWFYHITADVTDNGGATYTNTSQSFLAGDEIAWNGTNWTVVGSSLTAPFQFMGNIATNADFPDPAATLTTGVKDGHIYHCTAAVVDDDPTKTNTGQYFLLGDIIVWRTNRWYVLANANPLVDVGTITLNSDFPASTEVKRGYCYRILADVIDNGGATTTNTGQVFSAGDHIMWDGVAGWAILGASDVLIRQGTIATDTDFPLIAFVKTGHTYEVTANVVDGAGITYTNTGLTFRAGDVIMWDGSTWINLGNKLDVQVYTGTPMVPPASDAVIFADTATIGGPSVVNLPAATAALTGRIITIADATGDATAHNVVITPDGTDTIDGVNAPYNLLANYEFVKFQCVGLGAWKVLESNAINAAVAAIVDDHVTCHVTALDIKTDEQNKSAALNGSALMTFVPTHIILKVVTNVGALNADGTVNVGTAADGTQIASGLALTGLTAVGATRVVPLAANTSTVLGNATLHANVESAETGAGTLELDVYVIGRQV